jgi:hypothetical protein
MSAVDSGNNLWLGTYQTGTIVLDVTNRQMIKYLARNPVPYVVVGKSIPPLFPPSSSPSRLFLLSHSLTQNRKANATHLELAIQPTKCVC